MHQQVLPALQLLFLYMALIKIPIIKAILPAAMLTVNRLWGYSITTHLPASLQLENTVSLVYLRLSLTKSSGGLLFFSPKKSCSPRQVPSTPQKSTSSPQSKDVILLDFEAKLPFPLKSTQTQ